MRAARAHRCARAAGAHGLGRTRSLGELHLDEEASQAGDDMAAYIAYQRLADHVDSSGLGPRLR